MANEIPHTMEEAYDKDASERKNWAGFVEGEVVAFFESNKLDKMSLDDGLGNRAKLVRCAKDNSIKIEYTSQVVI